jgi:hypothetical protein
VLIPPGTGWSNIVNEMFTLLIWRLFLDSNAGQGQFRRRVENAFEAARKELMIGNDL